MPMIYNQIAWLLKQSFPMGGFLNLMIVTM